MTSPEHDRKTRKQLIEENQRLRSRVSELESLVGSDSDPRAEEKLRDSQRAYAAIFEHSVVGKAEADLSSGRFTRVNQALADMTGYSVQELSRMSFSELTHADDRKRESEMLEPVRAGREDRWQIEKRYLRKDGSVIWVNVAGNVMRYEDGRPPRSFAVIQDITDRKRAEAELHHREELLQRALLVSRSFAFEWEPATDAVRRSKSCAPLLGLAGEEVTRDTARRYFQRVHPDDREPLMAIVKDLTPANSHYDTKYRISRPDGRITVVEESGQGFFDNDRRLLRLVGITTDVTAREQVQEALRQSEARYRILHENLRDGFVQVTMDGRIQEFNDAYCQMLGYSPEELRALTYRDLTPERWHAVEDRIIHEEILARGYSDVYEKEYRRKDGTLIPVELRTILSRDAAGQPLAMWGVVRETTERKKAEEALRRSEDLLRAVTDNSPDAIYVKDRESRWLFANPAVLRIVGKPAGQAIGKTDLELYADPQIGRAILENDRRILESGRSEAFEEIADTPEGRRTFLSIKAPRRDAEGNIIGIIGISHDITESKRAEETLRQSEQRYRLIFDRNPDGVFAMDTQGRFILANPACEMISGYPAPEMLQKTFMELCAPDQLGRAAAFFKRGLRARTGLQLETAMIRRDGRRVELWIAGEPILNEGEVVAIYCAAKDITARKQAESFQRALVEERERLLESERAARSEAERANRLKDEFLANLSHELRTPLNAILGWTQILRKPHVDLQGIQKGLEVIERNTRIQIQLISDLLDVSRIVSGKMRLETQSCDPIVALEGAIDSLAPAAEAKRIRIERLIEPLSAPVLGDPARLQQAFWNLLSNAIKFTPAGGRVQIAMKQADSKIEIVFRDEGRGIDPEFLPYVFDRFRQADSSAAKSHSGLGLGLAIVKHLVELHGGTVNVESAGAGMGASFTISLPAFAGTRAYDFAANPNRSTHGPAQAELTGLKVLFVDDEADAREIVKRLLQEHGAEVVLADSAAAAVGLLQQFRPDVLIGDIGMPGEDGYEMLRKIRELPVAAGGQTPAIALTAYSRYQDRTRAMLAGYQHHLTKPINAAELITTVGAMTRGLRGLRRQME